MVQLRALPCQIHGAFRHLPNLKCILQLQLAVVLGIILLGIPRLQHLAAAVLQSQTVTHLPVCLEHFCQRMEFRLACPAPARPVQHADVRLVAVAEELAAHGRLRHCPPRPDGRQSLRLVRQHEATGACRLQRKVNRRAVPRAMRQCRCVIPFAGLHIPLLHGVPIRHTERKRHAAPAGFPIRVQHDHRVAVSAEIPPHLREHIGFRRAVRTGDTDIRAAVCPDSRRQRLTVKGNGLAIRSKAGRLV